MRSTKYTLRSHAVVGEIVVGLVRVAVIIYDMVPRSNLETIVSRYHRTQTQSAYINAARQIPVWELQLEVELVGTFCEPTVSAEHHFVLKQRRESIAEVFTTLLATSGPQVVRICAEAFAWGARVLEDLDESMQRDHDMRDACRP